MPEDPQLRVGGTESNPCAVGTSSLTVSMGSGAEETTCFDAPEICPSLSPIRFCARYVQTDNVFNVLLLNKGERPLTINSIKVRGDTRCAFKNPQFSPEIGEKAIEPNDAMVVRFRYNPPAAGEDHIAIEMTSDADNLPSLLIPVCGKGVDTRHPSAAPTVARPTAASPTSARSKARAGAACLARSARRPSNQLLGKRPDAGS